MPNPIVVFVDVTKFPGTTFPRGWTGAEWNNPCETETQFEVIFLADNWNGARAPLKHTNRWSAELLAVKEHKDLSDENKVVLGAMGVPSISGFSHVPRNTIYETLIKIFSGDKNDGHGVAELVGFMELSETFRFYTEFAAELNMMILGEPVKQVTIAAPIACLGFFEDWNAKLANRATIETANGILGELVELGSNVRA